MPFVLGAFGTQFTSVVAPQNQAIDSELSERPSSQTPEQRNAPGSADASPLTTPGAAGNPDPRSASLHAPTQAPAQAFVCRVWGPESSPSAFSDLVVQLEQAGGMPAVEAVDHPISRTYMVYIDEFVSQSTLLKRQSALQDQNIEYSLLRGDDGGLSLSVGVFSQSRRANKQLRLLNSLGFPGAIKEMVKYETRYNLTAHVGLEADLYKSSTSDCMAIAHTR